MGPDWMGGNNKALGIPRVSTKAQEQGASPSIQVDEFEEYCKFHGLELVKIFSIAESAKDSEKRKKYHHAMAAALEGGIRHVIFYMGDREARNLTDNEQNEKWVLQDRLVLHYVKERKILHKYSPESDFTARDYQAVGAKDFSRRLRVKMFDVMKRKAEDGWFPGNHLPLGYIHQKRRDEHGREFKRGTIIVPDGNLQGVEQAQREFELRGYHRMTLEQIRKKIIDEGYIRQDRVKRYHVSGIERRLKNIFYDGRFIWQGKEYPGKHERIISPELWTAVQKTFGNRGLFSKKRGVFSGGWLKCGHSDCGCFISYDPKDNRDKKTGKVIRIHPLYHCSNGKGVHASQKNIREEKIWEQLGEAVDSITITEEFAKDLMDALNETQRRAHAATEREIVAYKDALSSLEEREDGLYENFCKGVLDKAGYQRQIQKVRTERSHFTELLNKANHAINDAVLESMKSTFELATNAKSLWLSRSPDERRDFLNDILSNPVLDAPIVRYDLKKPFATLREMKGNSNWRPLVEKFRIDHLTLAA